MILDAQNQFDSNVALTATAASTNYIDLSESRQIQQGEQLGVLITVSVTAASGGTYEFQLQSSASSGFGSTVNLFDVTIPAATLVAGAQIFIPLPEGLVTTLEFLRLYYILGGTSPTITLSSYLQPQEAIDAYTDYPSGFVIAGH
jgi:predicted membrane-bound spermidine synthase